MIFSRTNGWIGIDIGTRAVKLAQVQRRGSRIELLEALSIPRQVAWPDHNEEAADISSSQEIRAALSLGTRFRGRDAAVTLPMAVCDVRPCNVEGHSDAERRAAVSRELNAIFHDTSGPREFDFWSAASPLDTPGSSDDTIVLSVASSWSARVTRDLGDAGLVGQVLDGLPLATARAIALGLPDATEFMAAVDWGHHRATLCCVKDGRPLFVRCLRDCGFRAATIAICTSLGVTADESQKLLRDHGLPDRTGGEVTELQRVIEEVIREPLDRFVDELSRTTTYLSQQRRTLAPARVVLLGGGAAVKNMAIYLTGRMDLPVQAWRLDAAATALGNRRLPIEMYGPAIALSSLAWA